MRVCAQEKGRIVKSTAHRVLDVKSSWLGMTIYLPDEIIGTLVAVREILEDKKDFTTSLRGFHPLSKNIEIINEKKNSFEIV